MLYNYAVGAIVGKVPEGELNEDESSALIVHVSFSRVFYHERPTWTEISNFYFVESCLLLCVKIVLTVQ